jgi:hypothetical protein
MIYKFYTGRFFRSGNGGTHFNLQIGMVEQLKDRTLKNLKNKNLENYKLENQNLEKQKS